MAGEDPWGVFGSDSEDDSMASVLSKETIRSYHANYIVIKTYFSLNLKLVAQYP